MSLRNPEPYIDINNPFSGCKLQRAPYAKILTTIVRKYRDGFVLAINNEWGAGKTTFVKMWSRSLENEGLKTIYFNAWENDFEANPLIAVIAELKKIVEPKTNGKYGELLKKGAAVAQNIAPIIVKAVASKYIDTENLVDEVGNITGKVANALKSEMENYIKKRDGIRVFRETLQDFVINTNGGEPLIFIIDELDRCRPSYAVEVLEQVKHLFSVSGIVFVLSIDKIQLGHIIRGMYGSDKFDANEYLRRFIDLEYTIPIPQNELFVKHLYEQFDIDSFISSPHRRHRDFDGDRENLIDFATYLFTENSINLRLQEKIFAQISITLKAFGHNSYIHPHVLVGLCLIKNKFPDFYSRLRSRLFTTQDALSELNSRIKSSKDEIKKRHFIFFEAGIAYLYHSYISGSSHSDLLTVDQSSKTFKADVKSGYDTSPSQGEFIKFLEFFKEKSYYQQVNLGNLLEKIDLLSHISL